MCSGLMALEYVGHVWPGDQSTDSAFGHALNAEKVKLFTQFLKIYNNVLTCRFRVPCCLRYKLSI